MIHVEDKAMMKVSEFFKYDIDPFILGSFYTRILEHSIKDKHYFYCYSQFRQSSKVNDINFDFENYVANEFLDDLNRQSWPKNWTNNIELESEGLKFPKYKALYVLENDIDITKKSFFNKLHFKITAIPFIDNNTLSEEKKRFIRGFMECRGSVDTTGKYIAVDYFYDTLFELRKGRVLNELMDVPTNILNFNFRNLQKQYVSGENKRNTQLRMNIHWYASQVGFVNKYKSYIYRTIYKNEIIAEENNIEIYSNKFNPGVKDFNTQFSKFLDIYSEHIYNKDLTKIEINELRDKLNYNASSSGNSRNRKIVEIYREISEDKCASCLTTDTSINKLTNRPNFDIHHFIPYANDKASLDSMDNLVKLCPNCHDALRKSRSSKSQQINICRSILDNSELIMDFASAYFDIYDIDEIASMVQKMLK